MIQKSKAVVRAHATEVVRTLLNDPTNPDGVRKLVAADMTYVSLYFDNHELRRIMPWTGTRIGPEAVLDTYTRVNRFWHGEAFEIGKLYWNVPAYSGPVRSAR